MTDPTARSVESTEPAQGDAHDELRKGTNSEPESRDGDGRGRAVRNSGTQPPNHPPDSESVVPSETTMRALVHGLVERPTEVADDELANLFLALSEQRPGLLERVTRLRREASIVDTLVDRRKKLRMTQAELASKIGTTQPSVAKFEALLHTPRLDTVEKYAKAVGMRLRLVEEENQTPWRLDAAPAEHQEAS